jgi:hypothetical protein
MSRMGSAQRPTEGAEPSRANLAAALALVAVVVWAVLIAVDADGPIWIAVGVLALAAAVTGWRAGAGAMPRGRALAALVVGGLLFVMFVGFTIAEA